MRASHSLFPRQRQRQRGRVFWWELAEEAQDWIVGHNEMDRLFGPILHAPVRSSSPPLFKLLRVYLSGLPEIQSTCLLSFYDYTAAADVLKCTAIILYSDYICRVINIRTNSKRVCSFPFHRLPIFSAAYKDGWGHCRVEDSMWKSIYTYGFLTIRKKKHMWKWGDRLYYYKPLYLKNLNETILRKKIITLSYVFKW